MYGQMTAGSWIYIGRPGIVQGTYETFFSVANQHFNGDPKGRWILTGGLGGMGGAQPLAATMAGFSMIAVECDETRIDFRLKTRYVDKKAKTLDEALAMLDEAKQAEQAGVDRSARQCRRRVRRVRDARHHAGLRDRSDERARSDSRLPAARLERRKTGSERMKTAPRFDRRAGEAVDGETGAGDVDVAAARRGHARLRQQHSSDGAGNGR